MKKLWKVVLFVSILFCFCLSNTLAKSDYSYLEINVPNVQAKNILLYNLNENKIIYEKKSQETISIASLTKIMTALIAIESFDNLEQIVTVPNSAFYNLSGYAEAGFKVGDKVTIKDLLYGTLLPSGADAAQALAILTSGNLESFVEKMNEKAISLEMNNTHYENPVGRDNKENYSTLQDLAKLLFYALDNPIFYEIYTTRQYTTLNNLELTSTLLMPSSKYNLNIESIKGSKSGYTRNAGLCLSSISEYNGIKYLLITAGSNYENGFPNHIIDTLNIYHYFFENFSYLPVLTKDEVLQTLRIEDAFSKTYEIKSDENIFLYLKNKSEISYVYQGIDTLNYKVKVGDRLGEIQVINKDVVLYTYEVFLKEKINYRHTKLIGSSIVFFLFFLILFKIFKRKRKI